MIFLLLPLSLQRRSVICSVYLMSDTIKDWDSYRYARWRQEEIISWWSSVNQFTKVKFRTLGLECSNSTSWNGLLIRRIQTRLRVTDRVFMYNLIDTFNSLPAVVRDSISQATFLKLVDDFYELEYFTNYWRIYISMGSTRVVESSL